MVSGGSTHTPPPAPRPAPSRAGPGSRASIERPRLIDLLAGRFDRRVTLLVGPAGFGKTTVLEQALEAAPASAHDVWYRCGPTDDTDLAAGLATALGRDAGDDGALHDPHDPHDPLVTVVDAVWARAPEPVAIVLDDIHLLPPGSVGAGVVAELVERLPANGHLVLAGRIAPEVPLTRLRASGQALVVEQGELGFDPDELERYAGSRGVTVAAVDRSGGWPALAEFHAGADEGDPSPWDAVLGELDDQRRTALRLLALFDDLDDELVAAVVPGQGPARTLVRDLPLVTAGSEGVRLHDLLREALLDGVAVGPHDGVRAGARLLQERARSREGFDALVRAEDEDGIRAFVAAFARTDFPEATAEDLRHIAKGLPPAVSASGHGTLLRAAMLLGEDGADGLEALEEATDLLAAEGDADGEAVALVRRLMVHFWQGDLGRAIETVHRLRALADAGVERAVRSVELSEAYGELVAGDAAAAIRRTLDSGALQDRAAAGLAGFLLTTARLDLGQAEEALQEVAASLPRASGRLRAALLGLELEARCLRRRPTGDDLRAAHEELAPLLRALGVIENLVLGAGGAAHLAVRTGDLADAERSLGQARLELPAAVGGRARIVVATAAAAVALESGRRDEARSVLVDLLEEVPLGDRPDRSWYRSLPLVYDLCPEVRDRFDEVDLGPAWAQGREAGRALVALADRGEVGPAVALDWRRPEEVLALTTPSQQVRLTVAAAAGGRPEARAVLATVPGDVRGPLRELAEGDGAVAATARELLATTPSLPRGTLEVGVLGELELRRDGVVVEGGDWRRARVQQLLVQLVARRRVGRDELVVALWPDHDERSGRNNLRVNLHHLHQVLEPDRPSDAPPFLVRQVDEDLVLVTGPFLQVDVDEFDSALRAAQEAERRGVPGEALDHLLRAVELHRGDLLPGVEDPPSVPVERLRMRGAFVGAAVRAGELLLARGDHDGAVRLAERAVAVEPVHERAHRLLARALAERGEPEQAARALAAAMAQLRDIGLEPEVETVRDHAELSTRPAGV